MASTKLTTYPLITVAVLAVAIVLLNMISVIESRGVPMQWAIIMSVTILFTALYATFDALTDTPETYDYMR